jgi:selenide,water dikinase
MAPGDLEVALGGLKARRDPNLIAGFDQGDKGVYKISDSLALIHTVDFFTPIVDDPYTYGQIAAANSLSDVYAMGGTPITAMNIVAFPAGCMDLGILREILRGGLDKMNEANTTLVGGHTIEDNEIKYGLAVTGTVDPRKVILTNGAQPGDRLILSKPLGTGIANTAAKRECASAELISQVQKTMSTLNHTSAEVMKKFRVHACTDITGFGLLGHLAEIVIHSGVGAELELANIPCFAGVVELARDGIVPGGTRRNLEFREKMVVWGEAVAEEYRLLLFDAQTSGGLLMSVAEGDARQLLTALHKAGVSEANIIGTIVADKQHCIRVV